MMFTPVLSQTVAWVMMSSLCVETYQVTPNALFAPNTLTTIITASAKNGSLVTITARARAPAALNSRMCFVLARRGRGN